MRVQPRVWFFLLVAVLLVVGFRAFDKPIGWELVQANLSEESIAACDRFAHDEDGQVEVTYEYEVDGRTYRGPGSVGWMNYGNRMFDDSIMIYYNPSSPSSWRRKRPPLDSRRAVGIFLGTAAVFLLAWTRSLTTKCS